MVLNNNFVVGLNKNILCIPVVNYCAYSNKKKTQKKKKNGNTPINEAIKNRNNDIVGLIVAYREKHKARVAEIIRKSTDQITNKPEEEEEDTDQIKNEPEEEEEEEELVTENPLGNLKFLPEHLVNLNLLPNLDFLKVFFFFHTNNQNKNNQRQPTRPIFF